MTTNDAFIRELLKAANEVDRLTMLERATLLRREATVLDHLRDQLPKSSPATDGAPDMIDELHETARDPSDGVQVAKAMLEGVDEIRIAERLIAARIAREQRE